MTRGEYSPAARSAPVNESGEVNRRWALRNGVHLWVLWGFAVVQPTFDVLAQNAARFFLLRAVEPVSLGAAIVAYAVLPPLLLLGLEALAGRFGERWRRRMHLFFVWVFVSLIVLYVLEELFPGGGRARGAMLVLGCWAAGIAGTVAYRRLGAVRLLLEVLSPAPVLFIGLLLLFSPARSLVFPGDAGAARPDTGARAPLVMVFFDEFPTSSLLDGAGRIDAARFPNLARLAREATWFPHATSLSRSTIESIPSILSGLRPRPEDPDAEELPTASYTPDTLFTLLGRSHRLEVMELFTQLCSPRLCPVKGEPVGRTLSLMSAISVGSAHVLVPRALKIRLPAIGSTWAESLAAQSATREVDPARLRRSDARRYANAHFEKFIASIRPQRRGERPPLHFLHVFLPHTPWKYLPSGQIYDIGPNTPAGRTAGFEWTSDRQVVGAALRRHLLQVQLVDRLVGRLVARLRAAGLYDRSVIVLAADHGGSISPGGNHRLPRRSNLADIAQVPLFVKAPGQTRGGADPRFVRTLDTLPTIAQMMGIRIPWKVDGRSWLAAGDTGNRPLSMTSYSGPVTSAGLMRQQRETVRRNIALLGPGGAGPDLFAIGPHRELLGRRVADLSVVRAAGVRIELEHPDRLRSVDPRGGFIPALIEGHLAGLGRGRHDVAVAVNGRIEAVGRTSPDGEGFAVIAPPRAFRRGANAVDVFAVSPAGGGLALRWLGGTGPRPRA